MLNVDIQYNSDVDELTFVVSKHSTQLTDPYAVLLRYTFATFSSGPRMGFSCDMYVHSQNIQRQKAVVTHMVRTRL